MVIEVMPQDMPRCTRLKMEKAIGRLERVGRQAARENPRSFQTRESVRSEGAPGHTTGLERILAWAVAESRADHLDAFMGALGGAVCGLLLNGRCAICPAKRHSRDNGRCRRVLGTYAAHGFKEDGR